VVRDGAPLVFQIWGLPFVAVGAYASIGRFFVDARQRASIHYGLTDQRVLIVSGVVKKQVKSLPLRSLSDLSIALEPAGHGTITFGQTSPYTGSISGNWWPGMSRYVTPAFESIPDAQRVYGLLRDAQRQS
jgi:hypothetical protein